MSQKPTYKRPWSPHGHLGFQTDSHLAYTIFCLFSFGLFLTSMAVTVNDSFLTDENLHTMSHVVAFIFSFGPIIWAWILCYVTGDRLSWRWPFQNENIFGGFGFFALMGVTWCAMPVYYAVQQVIMVR
jgi:hypothetical protein